MHGHTNFNGVALLFIPLLCLCVQKISQYFNYNMWHLHRSLRYSRCNSLSEWQSQTQLVKMRIFEYLNIQIFRNVLFLTFQNIKPGKPALYQSLLLPAEQNYLHMTGIVSHDSSDDDDHEFWEIFLIRDNKKKIKTFTFGRYQQRWLWNNVQVEEPEAMFRSKKQICFSQVSEGRYGEVVCCTESTRTIQSRANIKELFQRVWKLRRYC